MPRAANLETSLSARDVSFSRTIRKASRDLDTLARRSRATSKALRRMGRQFAAVASIETLRRAVTTQVQFADQLAKTARRLGTNVEDLSKLAFAARINSVEFRTLALALQRLGRRAGEAALGTGEARKALRALGIDAEQLVRLDVADQFRVIAARLRELPQAARLAVGQKIFDAEGLGVLQFIDSLESAELQAVQSGAVISGEFAALSENITNDLEVLKTRGGGALREFIQASAREINFLVDTMQAIKDRRIFDFLFGDPQPIIPPDIVAAGRPKPAPKPEPPPGVIVGEINAALIGGLTEVTNRQATAASAAAQAQRRLTEAQAQAEATLRNRAELGNLLAQNEAELQQIVRASLPVERQRQIATEETIGRLRTLVEILEKEGRAVPAPAQIDATIARIRKQAEEGYGAIDDHARTAARNIQSHFADSLFRGFDEGLKGMLRGWVDFLARMYAEMLASRIFGFLFPGGGGLAAVLSGVGSTPTQPPTPRAFGGLVTAGNSYLVGERGPELFVPAASGRIEAGGRGGVVVNNTVNAQGADKALIDALPGILARNREQTRSEIVQLMRDRRI